MLDPPIASDAGSHQPDEAHDRRHDSPDVDARPPRADGIPHEADAGRHESGDAAQAAGRDTGIKLMEIKRLREKGQRITLLNETQFWRLAGRANGKRKGPRQY